MPTCIEKSSKRNNHQFTEPRYPKCYCEQNQSVCKPCRVVEENRECCDYNAKLDSESDCKCNVKTNSKPMNVRVKLQLVNDGKNKGGGCLCAKYFEMLDACYGGMYPGCGRGSPPGQGPFMPQVPNFPYMPPQAPRFYDAPLPFLLNSPKTNSEAGSYAPIPRYDELCCGTYNAKPQDEYKALSSTRQVQFPFKFKENNTQTYSNDYNPCLNACEEYIEKLLVTKDTDKRGLQEKENGAYDATQVAHIQTLTHINAALAGITGTLQEIQKALQRQQIDNCFCNGEPQLDLQPKKLQQTFKYQQIDNCLCDKEPQIPQQQRKLPKTFEYQQIDNCLCDKEPQIPQKQTKLQNTLKYQQIDNCFCDEEPQPRQQQTKLRPDQIDNCLCDDMSRIHYEKHHCDCGVETEIQLHNTNYSTEQSSFDKPKRSLQFCGEVPPGYVSSASGRLIPYTVWDAAVAPKSCLRGSWPFLPKSMPPPPPPLPPPFRILPWEDRSCLKSTCEDISNHPVFNHKSPKVPQSLLNSSTFNPVRFPGFSTSTISKNSLHETLLPSPFETIPQPLVKTAGTLSCGTDSFGINVSSPKPGNNKNKPPRGTSSASAPGTGFGTVPYLQKPTISTTTSQITTPSVQQSSSSSHGPTTFSKTSLPARHGKTSSSVSKISGTSTVPLLLSPAMPPIAENPMLDSRSTNNFMPVSDKPSNTSTPIFRYSIFQDEIKLKNQLRANRNSAMQLKKVKSSSQKSLPKSDSKTAVEPRKLQQPGFKVKESRIPLSKRIRHTSSIGRHTHDSSKHKIKSTHAHRDKTVSLTGSEEKDSEQDWAK